MLPKIFHINRYFAGNPLSAKASKSRPSSFYNFFRQKADERGSSLIEFTLVFPILITIILTTLELGIMLAIQVNLQGCVQAGAYYGQSGQYTSGSNPTASAQAVMTQGAWGVLDPAKLIITIQSYPSFSAANSGGSGAAGTGNAGQVGMYKMQYSYSTSSPLVASFFGTTKVLQAKTYVKNEEYFP